MRIGYKFTSEKYVIKNSYQVGLTQYYREYDDYNSLIHDGEEGYSVVAQQYYKDYKYASDNSILPSLPIQSKSNNRPSIQCNGAISIDNSIISNIDIVSNGNGSVKIRNSQHINGTLVILPFLIQFKSRIFL